MILTPSEYCKQFKMNGKFVSAKTITRRCKENQLPTGHIARRIRGAWIIEIMSRLKTDIN